MMIEAKRASSSTSTRYSLRRCRSGATYLTRADRTINPALQRWYGTRAKSHMVDVAGASHCVYVSRPREVAAMIEDAAAHAK